MTTEVNTINDLTAAREQVFTLLNAASGERGHAMRLGVFATVDGDGHPRARFVVIRDFDRTRMTVNLLTDVRTPKVEELRANPRAEFVFYDTETAVQLRLSGRVTVHSDDAVADDKWAKTDAAGRFNYLTYAAPGSVVDAPTSGRDAIDGRKPTIEEGEAGRENFALLRLEIVEIDWVLLAPSGHRRAKFTFGDDGAETADWLIP